MAALHRAVALEQIDAVAQRVGEDLDFDVARFGDVFLDQHMVVAEARQRLALARRQRVGEILGFLDQAHALATTTSRRLDQHRVADLLGLGVQQRRALVVAVVARRQRHLGRAHQLLGFRLRAHGTDGRRRRADENQASGAQRLGELFVFREKTVARMHRLGAGALAGLDNLVCHQIGLARRRRPEQHGLVGQAHVAGIGVGLGIDGDGTDAHAAGSFNHPAGDLSAVGDEYLVKHAWSPAEKSPERAAHAGSLTSSLRRCAAGLRDWQSESW